MTATLTPPPHAAAATTTCRSCGSSLQHTLVDLGMAPLAAGCLHAEQLDQTEPSYPLQVWICDECFLVQLPRGASAERPVGEFAWCSSSSRTWLEHARRYTDRAIEELRLTPSSRVVEVGSNDGYLLQYFVQRGIPVLGIEVAGNVARAAIARGVPTRIERFDHATGRALRAAGLQADLLIANNVIAEVPDINDFVAGLKLLLAPRGVMTMEFPHLMRLIAGNQFDMIQHGRFSYFSLLVARYVLESNGLTIYDVDELETHGGSLRIFVCHSEDPLRPVTPRVDTLLARTLLNYCGIHPGVLDYTVDTDPTKQGRYLPGSHIPVHPPERIGRTRPDYVLILPWQLQTEIVPQLDYIREWGGRCVIPIPEIHVVAGGEASLSLIERGQAAGC
jgi:2-polyprenyl-3-methyl-5-hydroxy-6-metoxy-1,4-benzoquinol methylase